ncbi:MAG: NAD-dependent epimerase/dehydratase family protein [Candidatus Adiutrix sp.]|jgi:nucleoside-diphosphate-sugar epimerase|nr:NAD-dependent epimerase/dehydratase family protein [Candidatus Adiutrix sp.]
MKILLTGAQGFLGRRVLEMLRERGHEVRVLVRRPAPELSGLAEIREADLSAGPEVLARAAAGCGGVIHCAARSGVWGKLPDFIQANFLTTLNLLTAVRVSGLGWFVHTSSPSVVHTGRPLDGVDESAPYLSAGPGYPYSKMLAERLVLGSGLPAVALRPHLIWGPGDPHFLPRLVARARSGRLFLLESKALLDATYIDNAAWAHVLAAEKLASGAPISGRAYFIAQGEPLTAAGMIEKLLAAVSPPGGPLLKAAGTLPAGLGLAAAAGLEKIWSLFGLPGEPPLTRFVAEELTLPHWFDLSRARQDLGYQPLVSLAEGLRILARDQGPPAEGPGRNPG